MMTSRPVVVVRGLRSSVDGDQRHPMMDLSLAVQLLFQYQLHLCHQRQSDSVADL